VTSVEYFGWSSALSQLGGIKALLTGVALMFTSVYLKWLHQDLYEEFGKQRGFESNEQFQRAIKENLSFQKMLDNHVILERLRE
jgi:hypothetical protein